ncbi:MAG: hypothetical protein IT515_03300 [Burkholderiales bacterium]|nr:hypothetical protein [Burkholderiales bacterium]
MAQAKAIPASVVFCRLAGFGARPVAEQARLKEGLEDALAPALAPLNPTHRIVLDAPEGAAVVVLDGPDAALALGERLRAAGSKLSLAIGIDHGPVTLAVQGAHGPALVGDALTASTAIAEFAPPSGLLASRSFREALADVAPGEAEALRPSGTFTDSAVRSHDVFAPDSVAGPVRRRRALLLGTLGVAGILAAGAAVRRLRHAAVARARRPALIALAVTPWGDVFVDRELRGKTPPLRSLELGPGRHTIEVRNTDNAPVTLNVDLQPGESLEVRHAFPPPPPPPAVATPQPAAKPEPAKTQTAKAPPAKQQPAQERPSVQGFKRDVGQAARSVRDFFRGLKP